MDKSLNEVAVDKIRKYRADYNNNPPNAIFFMPAIVSTSGRLHSEFIRILFLQAHRETDRFFAASEVQSTQSNTRFCEKDTRTLSASRIQLFYDSNLSREVEPKWRDWNQKNNSSGNKTRHLRRSMILSYSSEAEDQSSTRITGH